MREKGKEQSSKAGCCGFAMMIGHPSMGLRGDDLSPSSFKEDFREKGRKSQKRACGARRGKRNDKSVGSAA